MPQATYTGEQGAPTVIACGNCFFCQQNLWSLCDNSNPNAWMAEAAYRSSLRPSSATPNTCACRLPLLGWSRLQTVCAMNKVLFISDAFPTGYMGADNCSIQPDQTVQFGELVPWACSR
jgi:threonine dehydrogenase-like Zn-dependent dehydrogenase